MKNQTKGKRALVIGLGQSGKAAARFLLHRGAKVTGIDGNQKTLKGDAELVDLSSDGLLIRHESDVLDMSAYDLVVTSPGIPLSHPVIAEALRRHIEVIGEVELACRGLHLPVLGVTGTNGKTTVTLLTTHVLNQSGLVAKAVGNVGVPLTSAVDKGLKDEILVMELSSYQLETLQTPIIDAAVILNVTPDHLDRHQTMEAYARAKISIKNCLKPHGILYIQDDIVQKYPHLLKGTPYTAFGGKTHDDENFNAARLLCKSMGITEKQFTAAAASFKKPPHRIEFVRICNGVSYYDDSKGTNIDATMKAVVSVPGPLVLIAGGVDKGASYEPWIAAFEGKVKAILAIGQAAPKMQADLHPTISVEILPSMDAAVHRAAHMTSPGETVLLSPGCASFDMFRDYAHRGEEFQKIVRRLSEGEP